MHEVVGRVDALQRCVQRGAVKNITTNNVRGFFDQWPKFIRVSGQTPQDNRLAFQQGNEPTADVTRSARQQEDGGIRDFRIR